MTQAMTIANTYKRESRYFIGASKRITISIWFGTQMVKQFVCQPEKTGKATIAVHFGLAVPYLVVPGWSTDALVLNHKIIGRKAVDVDLIDYH